MDQLLQAAPNVGVVTLLVGTILAVFRAVYTGALVPRSTHQDALNDRDAWREAHALSEERRRHQDDQVEDLLETARTTNALLTALNQVTARERAQ